MRLSRVVSYSLLLCQSWHHYCAEGRGVKVEAMEHGYNRHNSAARTTQAHCNEHWLPPTCKGCTAAAGATPWSTTTPKQS